MFSPTRTTAARLDARDAFAQDRETRTRHLGFLLIGEDFDVIFSIDLFGVDREMNEQLRAERFNPFNLRFRYAPDGSLASTTDRSSARKPTMSLRPR